MNVASIIEVPPAEAPALWCGEDSRTFGELRADVDRYRSALGARGIGPGSVVALAAANSIEMVTAIFATLGSGATLALLNPESPAIELEREIELIAPSLILVGSVETGAAISGHAVPVHSIDPVGFPTAPPLAPGLGIPVVADVDADSVAVLLFTSGTAGTPKAAELSHGNIDAALVTARQHLADLVGPEDVTYCVVPLFHVFGLVNVLGSALHFGGGVVLRERFAIDEMVCDVARHGVSVIVGPPTMWAVIADEPGLRSGDLASVVLAVSGAAKLPSEVADAFEDRFGIEITEGYGLTESTSSLTMAVGSDAPAGSIGRPLPGIEIRLTDENGNDVPVGDLGEIWARGPTVFRGYLGDRTATDQALDADGWLHTGDVAVVDDEGYLYLVDRAKDLIIVSGFNVFPAEVEEVLTLHPQVRDAAVVGIIDRLRGEVVRAFLVTEDHGVIDVDSVRDHAGRHLAGYKCPAEYIISAGLPRNLSGKLVRRQLV